jgi:rfaE bifunctional protein kinase chain/domain
MSIDELFDSFKDKRVLVIGDVMIDSYVHGHVKRISPEAPVPVINVIKRERRLGGAANVARNIQALGATPVLCSVLGDDLDAERFENLLTEAGMPRQGIIKSQNRVTTIKHRILAGSQHLLRVDSEDTHPLIDIDKKSLQGHINNLMKNCDLVIFEDYDKGTIDHDLIQDTIALANERGIPTAVDPKKLNFLSYKKATLFKPNLKELKEGLSLDFDISKEEEIRGAVQKLNEILDAENYLITLSEHGIYYASPDEDGKYKAHLRSIADVSGAGDTVISIAGLALASGIPLKYVAELSNLGGGIVCESPGVVPIDKDRLLKEASSNEILAEFFD